MITFSLDWNIATIQHKEIDTCPDVLKPLRSKGICSNDYTTYIQPTELLYPGGVDACLAVIGLGSTRNTVLHNRLIKRFGSEEEMVVRLKRICDLEKSPEIKSRTAVFFDVRAEPMQDLYAHIREYIVMSQGDFRRDSLNSARIITHWIGNNSGFQVTISPVRLQSAYAIIISTLWFKDIWINKFDTTHTKLLPFYTRTETKNVLTMTKRDNIEIYENGNIISIRLPFYHGAVAEFIMGLSEEDTFQHTYKYQSENITLFLPKFEHKAELDLSSRLSNMGYGDMFINGNLHRLGRNKSIAIRSVTQFIHVRFDEEGTEVKTGNILSTMISAITTGFTYRTIQFNHPFHYRIIKDNITLVHGYYKG